MKKLIIRWAFILGALSACLVAVNAKSGSMDMGLDLELGISNPWPAGHSVLLDSAGDYILDSGGNNICVPE